MNGCTKASEPTIRFPGLDREPIPTDPGTWLQDDGLLADVVACWIGMSKDDGGSQALGTDEKWVTPADLEAQPYAPDSPYRDLPTSPEIGIGDDVF